MTKFRICVIHCIDYLRITATFTYLILAFVFSIQQLSAQTTFTESAASYNLNIGQNKDGGHAWADFDLDGDQDVLVLVNNTSQKARLMRNNGDGTFTNVQTTLAPGILNARAERQAAWGDLNNDGRPDFMITSSGNSGGNPSPPALQIFLQNLDGTFGNAVGGTNPITVGRNGHTITINPMNAEGAGFFDFEGDGDLDIFFDSHNYGIEILRNNYIDHTNSTVTNPTAALLFSHITTGNGNGVVNFGLNQFATDGDYGTAADANDDGWVDIFMRKRDENDFFLNQGGIFTNGSDLAQAANGNKGGNGLWDLDNDGDLDAVWTENGLTQIYRNDGSGTWTALGTSVFPGLPQPNNSNNGNSSNRIDALAGGDIDNDGDIDILLVGQSRSYLYINQLNSPTPAPGVIGSGSPMSFSLDPETFNTNDGEGTTMVDVDDDGDLDIYMNINGSGNQLWINNLAAANRNNHLMVNVIEDRASNGDTGGFAGRIALGTNVLIRDCSGNIVSGLRQVNGVYGHGTQQPETVHFGLPLGENETYIIEVRYPNFNDPEEGITRLIATGVAQPSTIAGTNHYNLTTTNAETIQNLNAPEAEDDLVTIPYGNSVSIQINLFTNDSEPDGENFFIESITQPTVGSVTIDDANNGLVTYSYNNAAPFPGSTSFTYTIVDDTYNICAAQGKSDTATVTVYEPCSDPTGVDTDGDGINDICDYDDDNDGISDFDEQQCSTTNPGVLGVPTTVLGGTAVDEIYTDYNGYWYSSTASINSIEPNLSHNLLAFGSGGNLYSTGVVNTNMLDMDSNGRYDAVDTNGDGNGNINTTEMEWRAFRPNSNITNKVALESALNDGTLGSALGSTVIANLATDPLNPLLTNGPRGLDLGTGIANVFDSWFFNISTIDIAAVNDGLPDILITQVAQISSTVDHNIAFFDAAGNPVGNQVRVTSLGGGELSSVIGAQRYDVYQTNGSSWQVNVTKNIRMATLELSEFGLDASNVGNVALMRLTLNNSADTAFLAYNMDSFGEFCTDLDTDGDGIVDRLDLDSDNDGIYDVVEAGHNLTHTNGRLTGAVGADGIADALQTNPNNQTTTYIVADTNGDGIPDFKNLDSDGDGCTDVNEAGFTDNNDDGYLGDIPLTVSLDGVVTSGVDGYTTPVDADGNGIYDYTEVGAAPTITDQPTNTTICPGCSGTITANFANADRYQWQLFNGSTWENLVNGGLYEGTTTQTLTITNPTSAEHGNTYRIVGSSTTFVCSDAISNPVVLSVRINTVITNRRITYRVDPN